ncbi:MAG: HPF/RaiA family ribosome-associated protein [Weeksellaceae bacterium]|nr:HPF/RaiA family ribosome-associated protein [Weeksellaceae bacterium]
MQIKVNTDNEVYGTEEFKEFYRSEVERVLGRFDKYVTWIEVYFSDGSSNKDTLNDKKCVIEARFKGLDPEHVSDQADELKPAFDGAVRKMRTVLDRLAETRRNW